MGFDWKAIVGILVILYVFTYAGLWWGILSVLVVTVALGWKNRHDGPFPTNQTSATSEVDEDEVNRLVEQEMLGEELDHICDQLEDSELQDNQRDELNTRLEEVSAKLNELNIQRKNKQ